MPIYNTCIFVYICLYIHTSNPVYLCGSLNCLFSFDTDENSYDENTSLFRKGSFARDLAT